MNTEAVYQALEIMWKGMFSIFAVIIILTLMVYIINRVTQDKKEEE